MVARAEPHLADTPSEIRHASAVAIDGAAVLIEGPSGSGKSGLALELIGRGAVLIADDRARLVARDGWPFVLAPERLAGVIEARGIGLVATPHLAAAPLRLIVDMGEVETDRLPDRGEETVLGQRVARIRRVDAPHFPSAIVALVRGGWWHDG